MEDEDSEPMSDADSIGAEEEIALQGMARDHKALIESDKGGKRPICFNWFCFRAEYLETKEDKIKATLSELIFYLMFLAIICILVVSSASVTLFFYTSIMKHLFVEQEYGDNGNSFQSITKLDDFWEYARGPFLDNLYWDEWYNSEDLKTYNLSGYIYYQNKLLGLPRLRQLRVKSSKCLVTSDFEQFSDPCYDEYKVMDEDKNSFGDDNTEDNDTAWVYQDKEDVNGFDYWGHLAWYSGSGYIQDLPQERNGAEKIISTLYNKKWIKRGARAVFITFTIYNANSNCICIVRLACEFPATGGAVPSWSIDSMALSERDSPYMTFIRVVQIIFILFIIKFLLEEMIQIYWDGFGYLKQFWNFFDILLISLAILSIIMYWVTATKAQAQVKKFMEGPKNIYTDFVSVAYWIELFETSQAVTAFVAFIKSFKFIGFNKTMIQLSMTLSSCAKDLAGFFIMFFIVFLAFTQLGFLLFGSQVEDFSTFMSSFYTLFRIVLGDFNFHVLEQANRFLGPIFFMLFVFFVFFVLINMFLAIINDTYSEVKSDVQKQGDVLMMSDFLQETYFNLISKLTSSKSKRRSLSLTSEVVGEKKPTMSLDEFKAYLYVQGYTDVEIEPVFRRFDTTKTDGILDSKQQELMLADLEALREARTSKYMEEDPGKMDADIEDFLRYSEFQDLLNRVNRMERALKDLVHNVENVLVFVSKP